MGKMINLRDYKEIQGELQVPDFTKAGKESLFIENYKRKQAYKRGARKKLRIQKAINALVLSSCAIVGILNLFNMSDINASENANIAVNLLIVGFISVLSYGRINKISKDMKRL